MARKKQEKKIYEVIYEAPVVINGKKYKKGDKIEDIKPEIAERLIHYGIIKEVDNG